jgi:hypothetical protein
LPWRVPAREQAGAGARSGTGARHTVASGRPVYIVHDVSDPSGRLVHYERRRPFSRNGQSVDRILASFEFICPEGAFERQGLMDMQTAPPALRLSATIEPQMMA